MNSDRKEPRLSSLAQPDKQERIPTLSERVAPDLFDNRELHSDEGSGDRETAHAPSDPSRAGVGDMLDDDGTIPRLDDYDFIDELAGEQAPVPEERDADAGAGESSNDVPDISAEDIEALADRVLDQIAPALREAVAAAVSELLAAHSRNGD